MRTAQVLVPTAPDAGRAASRQRRTASQTAGNQTAGEWGNCAGRGLAATWGRRPCEGPHRESRAATAKPECKNNGPTAFRSLRGQDLLRAVLGPFLFFAPPFSASLFRRTTNVRRFVLPWPVRYLRSIALGHPSLGIDAHVSSAISPADSHQIARSGSLSVESAKIPCPRFSQIP